MTAYLVELYAVDFAGNEEDEHHTFEVAIDATDPYVDISSEKFTETDGTQKVLFTVVANDETSGMDKVEFKIDGVLEDTVVGTGPYEFTVVFEGYDASTVFTAVAYDNAGNDAEDTESGIEFSKQLSQSQSRTKTLPVSRVILRLGL